MIRIFHFPATVAAIFAGLFLVRAVVFSQQSAVSDVETHLFEPLDSKRERTVPLKIYLSKTGTYPKPVVIFSHGLGGSREGNPYLGNHWAENGYVAVFMQHPGSDQSVWEKTALRERFNALKDAAGVKQTIDRFEDVPFVIDQLEKWNAESGHPVNGKLDLEHIGMAGHSFGAVTTMGLSGRKFPVPGSYRDERIDAFLPMSPQPGKRGNPSDFFGHLDVPILCMTGTEDGSPIDDSLKPEDRKKVYAALPTGDKYQLVFDGAHHFAFGESRVDSPRRKRNPNHHPAILKISTRYWDAYLKEDEEAKKWLQSKAPRKDCPLDEKDVWEWK